VSAELCAELTGDRFLEALDAIVFEFDDLAAVLAYEMVVMMLIDGFVAGLTVVEVTLLKEVAFAQQPKGSIDRGIANVRADFFDLGVEFLGADVSPDSEKNPGNVIALAGRLESALFEAGVQGGHPLLCVDMRLAAHDGAASRGAFFYTRHRKS
jgi:hypothetical protein